MKWYEMLKGYDRYNHSEAKEENTETVVENTSQIDAVSEAPTVVMQNDKIVSGVREEIKKFLENFKPQEAPANYENTELNDNQIRDVLETMLDFQDEYFEATPLNSELIQAFVWNIPKDIYKAHQYIRDHCLPKSMDPIYWFYMFCMKNPEQAMGKFLVQAINSISDEEFEEISNNADEYDSM